MVGSDSAGHMRIALIVDEHACRAAEPVETLALFFLGSQNSYSFQAAALQHKKSRQYPMENGRKDARGGH